MFIIRVVSSERAKRLRSVLKQRGVVEAKSTKEAKRIEKEGSLTFVNEIQPEYEMRYIPPRIKHLCRASRAWYKLRAAVVEEAISIDDVFRTSGSFLARMERDGFLTGIPGIIDKYEPMGECSCEKGKKMGEIRELLESAEELQQEEIDGCYADLERLLDLKMSEPSPILATGKKK